MRKKTVHLADDGEADGSREDEAPAEPDSLPRTRLSRSFTLPASFCEGLDVATLGLIDARDPVRLYGLGSRQVVSGLFQFPYTV